MNRNCKWALDPFFPCPCRASRARALAAIALAVADGHFGHPGTWNRIPRPVSTLSGVQEAPA
eukprot:1856135-Pyramimonas_sp.AAC.1